MNDDAPSLRDRLRALPMFDGDLPEFDIAGAPSDPMSLLVEWVEDALARRVLEPHAMTLATASEMGEPSARTLLLKDVDAEAVWFASLSDGPKGHDLAENPRAALVLYWREVGRQVRIVGQVEAGPRELAQRDFLARHPNARAGAIAGEQSRPISDQAARIAAAQELVAAIPDFVPDTWQAYRVVPETVEFWQGARKREQVRLRYRRVPEGWIVESLWP